MVYGYVIIQKKSGGDGPLYPVSSSIKIGRGTHCGIRVHMQSVSEEHSLIQVKRGSRAHIQNLSATSATLVNGVSVGTEQVALQHGDVISIGERAFRWIYPEESEFYLHNDILSKRRRSFPAEHCESLHTDIRHKRCSVDAPGASGIVSRLYNPHNSKFSLRRKQEIIIKSLRSTPKAVASPEPSGVTNERNIPIGVPHLKSDLLRRVSGSRAGSLHGLTPTLSLSRKTRTPLSSAKSTRGSKRRLSSPHASGMKRMKIESPKTIDKKKRAALIGIHRKSQWVDASPSMKVRSTTSTSQTKRPSQTPNLRSQDTPAGNSGKKSVWKSSSCKKARRPLFSEVLKKAKQRVKIQPSKKVAVLSSSKHSKVTSKQVAKNKLAQEIPKAFHFNSTGHANSPDTIFIGRKVTATPAVTRKGRKDIGFAPSLLKRGADVDFVGLNSLFKTPSKTTIIQSLNGSPTNFARDKVGSICKSSKVTCISPIKISASTEHSNSLNSLSSGPPNLWECSKNTLPVTRSKSLGSLRQAVPLKEISRRFSSYDKHGSSVTENLVSNFQKENKTARRSRSSSEPLTKNISSVGILTGVSKATPLKTPRVTSTPAPSKSFVQSPKSTQKSGYGSCHSAVVSPIKSSLKSSPCFGESSSRAKSLSVSFDDDVQLQNGSSETPDENFDFDAVKTPNVPQEMFVSSIFSSGSASNRSSAGSARRKGITPKSPNCGSEALRGIRRLLKTPVSPAGYVDVRGIKRLLASPSKTPTYLAVEGVKKLFGDASAAAQNSLSTFVGVKELFASPSPSKIRPGEKIQARSPEINGETKPSPVAKILAEVEGKRSPSYKCSPALTHLVSERALRNSSPAIHSNARRKLSTSSLSGMQKASPSLPNSSIVDLNPTVKESRRFVVSPSNSNSMSQDHAAVSPSVSKPSVGDPDKTSSKRPRRKKPIHSLQESDVESGFDRMTRRRARLASTVTDSSVINTKSSPTNTSIKSPRSAARHSPQLRATRGTKKSVSPKSVQSSPVDGRVSHKNVTLASMDGTDEVKMHKGKTVSPVLALKASLNRAARKGRGKAVCSSNSSETSDGKGSKKSNNQTCVYEDTVGTRSTRNRLKQVVEKTSSTFTADTKSEEKIASQSISLEDCTASPLKHKKSSRTRRGAVKTAVTDVASLTNCQNLQTSNSKCSSTVSTKKQVSFNLNVTPRLKKSRNALSSISEDVSPPTKQKYTQRAKSTRNCKQASSKKSSPITVSPRRTRSSKK